MYELKITQIGNSLGTILPKELLDRLNVGKGDRLFATASPDGVRITSVNEEFARQMSVLREVMGDYRDVLHELAK